jgi:ribose transport system ATP-binding protein
VTNAGSPIVRMIGIDKAFHGVPVLRGVSLDLLAGEVHFLAGENGAGKSTLMRILAGVHEPDAGSIEIRGEPVQLTDPRQARALGVGMIHQELNLAPNLTVAENLVLGREPRRSFRRLDRRRVLREAEEALEGVGADFSARTPVAKLSTGQQQLVEIGRALAQKPQILILDEPTASLSEPEEQRLLSIVHDLRRDGLAVVFITHRMDEIGRLADRVTVLRDGQFIDTLDRATATPERIVSRMVGRSLSTMYTRDRPPAGAPRLEVRGLTDGAFVAPAHFEIRAGEIVGMAGLIGSGRTELARLIFGADRSTAGDVLIDGAPARASSPGQAMRHGIALLPESRKEQGLVLGLSVADNLCLSVLSTARRRGVLRPRQIKQVAEPFVQRLRIKSASLDQPVSDLSGGNQQKVLLARCLVQAPRVLILDEPTRGVDVGAKSEIYQLVNEVAATGVAVLFISSELPEVLGMSDRVLVMREGRIVADLKDQQLTEEDVMRHATGLAAEGTSDAGASAAPADHAEVIR